MKNFRLFSYLFASLFLVSQASAQISKSKIKFDEEIHDFGEININGGPVLHEFTFVNIGDMPIILNGVKTSCGCTTPEWTKEPVIPGQSGSIKVSFNPIGRPGPFTKTITISCNDERQTIILKITGTVMTGDENITIDEKIAAIKSTYKYEMGGDLRLKYTHVAFNEIVKGKTKSKIIKIANKSLVPDK
jgi:uncharacterized Zn-binding protein involved in type VI secretion